MNNSFNNPMAFLMNALQRGGNPRMLIEQIARQNPDAAKVLQILGNKTGAQQRMIVENMAKERGVDLNELARSLGISIPSNR